MGAMSAGAISSFRLVRIVTSTLDDENTDHENIHVF